jgi:hypothetical protein
MTIVVTNWQMRVTRLDASVDGKQQPIPWLYGSNASVSIDLAPALEHGEEVENPVVSLRRLPASNETDYTTFASGLEGSPVVTDTFVSQVLQNLERGCVYRLEVLFGATNNRRGVSQLIECVE